MYKRLYKAFYYETFTYIVNAPKESVIQRLDLLFTEKSGLFKQPNLSGKFVDYPDTFFLTQKWWFGHIRNFEREPAILKGVISKISDTQTEIEISVRPNSIFLMFFIFLLPYGAFNLYRASSTKDLNSTLVGLWSIVFCFPILYLIAKGLTKKLRTNFETYMGLKPATERKLPLTQAL